MILIAILQSSLYFYYQNFYVQSIEAIKEDDRLHFLVATEFCDDNAVHEEVLKYIVTKYCENSQHDFDNDEEFMVLKMTVENLNVDHHKHKLERLQFYEQNFHALRRFVKNKVWRIFIFVCDLAIVVCLIIFTEYYYFKTTTLIAGLPKTKTRSADVEKLHVYYKTITRLFQIAWVANLPILAHQFMKIIVSGWKTTFKSAGTLLAAISTVFIFSFATIFVCFGITFMNDANFDKMMPLIKVFAFFVCLKVLTLVLNYGKRVSII